MGDKVFHSERPFEGGVLRSVQFIKPQLATLYDYDTVPPG
jgi:hypothetical protein